MSTTPDVAALQGKASVALPMERAFAFFTESFGSWWPSAYHIGASEMADAILSLRWAGAGTSAGSMAANAIGGGCWCGSPRTGWW